jgi:hypothetical protein
MFGCGFMGISFAVQKNEIVGKRNVCNPHGFFQFTLLEIFSRASTETEHILLIIFRTFKSPD